jgi:hypothetical protein
MPPGQHVPPLEAGDHQLRVVGMTGEQVLHVSAITGLEIKAAELTVTIE